MPTARAPMPILRKLPVVVPMRSWPTACAPASRGRAASPRTRPRPSAAATAGAEASRSLEVIVEPQSPAHARADVAGVAEHGVDLERCRVDVQAAARLRRLAGDRVDAA